ncbi:hypothetical protein Tco_1381299 [Tanacetum coccineum]
MQHPQHNNNYAQQPSLNMSYMQQPMPNPKNIFDPKTVIDMAMALMAKAFKLNHTTPTTNNQTSSSNPSNRQIARPGMNMHQDRQMLMVGDNVRNQFRPNAGQIARNQNGYNLIAQKEEAGIQLIYEEFDFMATAGAYDEIEEVNANCTLEDNLQQASTSRTQSDNAPVYDSDGLAENDSNVISAVSSVEQSGEQ